jgi:F-type H+-transporting ATPase subunit c
MKKWTPVLIAMAALLLMSGDAYAQDSGGGSNLGSGITMGLAVLGGTLAQGMAAKGMYESVSRNPQAAGALNTPFILGLAFIESLCLFALVVAFGING